MTTTRATEDHIHSLKSLVGQADARTFGCDPDTGEELDNSQAAFLRELASLLRQQADQLEWEANNPE